MATETTVGPLHTAVLQNDLEALRKLLLGTNADVDSKSDINGDTALHLAIKRNNAPATNLLLGFNANFLCITNKNNETALDLLKLVDDLGEKEDVSVNETVENLMKTENYESLIIHLKRYFNVIDKKYITKILHNAVEKKMFNFGKYLVQLGADINDASFGNETILHLASSVGNMDFLEYLMLSTDVDIKATNKHGDSALHYAVLQPLHKAIAHIDDQVVFTLNKVKEIIETECEAETGAVHSVSNVLIYLIEKGADGNTENNDGNTFLHLASYFCDVKTISSILNVYPDLLHMKNIEKETVVHIAAKYNSEDVVRFYIEQGVSLVARNKDNDTVLHYAAANTKHDNITPLVEAGANIKLVNAFKKSVLHQAALCGTTDSVRRLINYGADVNAVNIRTYKQSVLHFAAENCKFDTVSILIESGANVNAVDDWKNSVLHYAVQYNSSEVVQKLIDNQADVNAINKNGYSVLHYAAQNEKHDTMTPLVKAGADLNVVNHKGETALHLVESMGKHALVNLLIENGADANYKNNKCESPQKDYDKELANSCKVE